MKMGLSMVLVGHVNFLLGALVHGVVLRHINLHKQARAMEYAVSNVFAMTSGLVVSIQTEERWDLLLKLFIIYRLSPLSCSKIDFHSVLLLFQLLSGKQYTSTSVGGSVV